MKRLMALVFFGLAFYSGTAQLRLPAVISSHMVLQQQSSVRLWGWAGPSNQVVVTTSWDHKTDSVKTTRDACWQIFVKTPPAGGPYSIRIESGNRIELEDIMIGEVWVCSGQSNMEMNEQWGLPDAKAELPICANPNIRFFYVPKTTGKYPQDDCKGNWALCDSNSMKAFSAAGYFFGKKLNASLQVPIGLINANWGGTAAEVWAPSSLVLEDSILSAAAAKRTPADWWPNTAGYAYNGMIAPLTNFSIAGVIWYQGESNVGAANTYGQLFTGMIGAWRKAWNKEFPFYYVQIAPYKYGEKDQGARLQEAQAKCMQYPRVGMVVVTDLVNDTNDIHPKNKHEVGYRLANWALAENYHKEGVVYKSPVFKEMSVVKGKAIIQFEGLPSVLQIKGDKITELWIAGADHVFYPAEAKLEKDRLIGWSKMVKSPVALRYGFGNTAMGNLFSKEGLPVTPFRTDDW